MDADPTDRAAATLIALDLLGAKDGRLFMRAARANLAGDTAKLVKLLARLERMMPKTDCLQPEQRLSACLVVVAALSRIEAIERSEVA